MSSGLDVLGLFTPRYRFAISDVHGRIDLLKPLVETLDFGNNQVQLVVLGDMVDGSVGSDSLAVLNYLYQLQCQYGAEKIVVLKGNHDCDLLEFVFDLRNSYMAFSGYNYQSTLRSFLGGDYQRFYPENEEITLGESEIQQLSTLILKRHRIILEWLRKLPFYYETTKQIYVHAGIEETEPALWKHATTEATMVGKYPPEFGSFPKDIIAGHVGTSGILQDPDFHGIVFDGFSHYFLDGTVDVSNHLNMLCYDEVTKTYSANYEIRTI